MRQLAVDRLGLGVGVDLPWGSPHGFVATPRGDRVAEPIARFVGGGRFSHWFVSWQPRDRNRLDIDDYAPAFDDLFARVPEPAVRALHHTALNLATTRPYRRRELIDFTNALIERYGFAWVNEDLGMWSLGGRALPYPLPPLYTDDGVAACIRNVAEVQAELAAPLSVELPGVSEGTSVVVGGWHPFDHFREVIEATDSPCTLDTGHLLSWQWLRGRRGDDLYAELDRLPLASCVEIHLAGAAIRGGRFVDTHDGLLLDEQIELLARLVRSCPALRAVTYEDPRPDDHGRIDPRAAAALERVRQLVEPS